MEYEFDPFSLSDRLRHSFTRYLLESHPIHESEVSLRDQFVAAVQEKDRFVLDPLISIIPSYETSVAPAALFERDSPPRLSPQLTGLDSSEFDASRLLYRHQFEAIQKIQDGRNVVVATGTGSGKTECFLLPVLSAAVDEHRPGPVAVLVYPMNALANDQLDRLRGLIGSTSVTFGRYTGQTPRTEADASPQALADARRPNERFTRAEIRIAPPQILLTNFAMLEYLLLRPDDQSIFQHDTLRYVILDEAHSYSGSQGIDIGLLMRRLQAHCSRKLQFVLTSATLGDPKAPDVRKRIAQFAWGLTGQDFAPEDLVFGSVTTPFTDRKQAIRTPELLNKLAAQSDLKAMDCALQSLEGSRHWLDGLGIRPQEGCTGPEVLFNTLRELEIVERIYLRLRERPHTLQQLGEQCFEDGGKSVQRAIQVLLAASAIARPHTAHAGTLMTMRMHHFFRGLSGASVALKTGRLGESSPIQKLYLEDRSLDDDAHTRLVPLRTCIHCGMPALIVRVTDDGKWSKPGKRPGQRLRILTWFDSSRLSDAQDESTESESGEPSARRAYLSLTNDEYLEDQPQSDGDYVELLILDGADDEGNLPSCPCCGGIARPYQSVLRDFETGEDAPTALLAEEIVRVLPPHSKPERAVELPSGGRNLLAFSDSRQRAAHFNSYLTWTTSEPSFVQPLLIAAREIERDRSPGTMREVIERSRDLMLTRNWIVKRDTDDDGFERSHVVRTRSLTPDDKRRLAHELGLTLYKHITAALSQRTKFTGLLLAAPSVELERAELAELAAACPELFANQSIGEDALQRLLLYVVRRAAVHFWPDTIKVAHLLPRGRGPQAITVHRNPCGPDIGGRRRIRWNPFETSHKYRKRAIQCSRTAAIVRHILRLSCEADDGLVSRVLDSLWSWMTNPDGGILENKGEGDFQLPAGRILLRTKAEWYACTLCGTPSIHPMGEICEYPSCRGHLQRVEPEAKRRLTQRTHRADRYEREPMPLVVREHTAQLTFDHSRKYQEDFKAGLVNVLSSSTTFEMGVDVGQLQAVLLRNVPPTASNYIQRAGRAGRRRIGVAHAVTYARRLPHDQYHYFTPHDIVVGQVSVPVIYTANTRLTQRHVNSCVLGQFLKAHRDEISTDRLQVRSFFPTNIPSPLTPADRFATWCEVEAVRLKDLLAKIIPEDCDLDAERALRVSAETFFSREVDSEIGRQTAWFKGYWVLAQEYLRELEELEQQFQAVRAQRDLRAAGALMKGMASLIRLREQLAEKRLLDFLAEQHWLPNYAFPQDVVQLTVRQEEVRNQVNLQRDREIGISEYAPGSEIIADGHLFESVGINLEKREPELKWFRTCPKTRQIFIGVTEQAVGGSGADTRALKFLEPLGFTTHWSQPAREPNLFRLRPPSNTEVFLVEGAQTFEPVPDLPNAMTGIRKDGRLFRANLGKKGNGFLICTRCGVCHGGPSAPRGSHDAPYGGSCTGRFEKIVLTHQFETDVLQIRFAGTPAPSVDRAEFWWTLSTALKNVACRELAIDPRDLDSTYRSYSDAELIGELVLYDRVPGGAGHVGRVAHSLVQLFRAVVGLLEHCPNRDCDIRSSCYVCLRSHHNQFQWDLLQRAAPLPWLKGLLA